MGFFDKLVKILKDLWKKINPTDSPDSPDLPDPPDPPDPPNDDDDLPETPSSLWPQRASFLFDNAGTRAMNMLSYNASESQVKTVMNRQKKNGDKTVWLFFSNQGDGKPAPTSMYKALFGGDVSTDRITIMRNRLDMYRDNGFKVVAWLTADDSSAISNASLATHKKHISDVMKYFDDQIDAYCVGLEMNEDNRKNMAKNLIAYAKSLSKKDIGVHLTNEKWEEAIQWGADTLYYQTGFGKSAAQVKAECASVIGKLNGRCKMVLAEYSKSSDTKSAREIGQAAMTVSGCMGTGNGR